MLATQGVRHSGAAAAATARLGTAWLALLLVAALDAVAASAQHDRWGADYFPNVTLTTHEGKTVRFYDDLIKGKIVAIDLIYTTCQYACPLETARLAQVQRVLGERVGRDIFFYSITIDPDHDTPQVLKDYAEKYRVGPGWLFLTGRASDIELISKKIGLYSEPNPSNPDGHTPSLLVGNEATGQWMRNAALDNPKFLARTIDDWLNSWQSGAKKALRSFADAPIMTFDQGQYTFRNHCAACHTIGGGDTIGPDLKGVTANRDRRWLTRFIATPDRLFAEDDPIAHALLAKYNQVRMPNLSLTDDDAAVLVDYIARRSGEAAADAPANSAAPDAIAPRPAAADDWKPILDAYLRIQQALAADRLDGVKDSARAIATQTARIGSRLAEVRMAVNPFAQVTDLNAAREAFAALSDAMIAYARSAGGILDERVKLAYCPMARKHWLQDGEKILNPFFGKQMSDCGRFISGDLGPKN